MRKFDKSILFWMSMVLVLAITIACQTPVEVSQTEVMETATAVSDPNLNPANPSAGSQTDAPAATNATITTSSAQISPPGSTPSV